MAKILALAGLLAAQIVLGTCAKDYIVPSYPFSEGSIMKLEAKATGEITECFVITNRNIKYKLFPQDESPGWYDGSGRRCSIDIRDVPISYAGFWIIEAVTENGNEQTKFLAQFKQSGILRPANYISSVSKQWATVWLDNSDRDDLTACNLTNSQMGTFDLLNDKLDNNNMSRVNGCGVRMLITSKMKGQWIFNAQFGNAILESAIFQISIPHESLEEKTMIYKNFEIGKSATLELYEIGALFCQLTRPDGLKLPLIFGACVYKIDSVSLRHSGVWKASYGKSEKLEVTNLQINVTTTDPDFLEGSVDRVDNKINLMCRSGKKSMKFCTFIRPDKVIINLPAGVGNDKYSYYGNGYQERFSSGRLYSDCGLTIENPSMEDFGAWTCEMNIDGTIRGTVINVEKPRAAARGSIIDNPDVFVKRGDNFKIHCSSDVKLNYCWITSPNGTAYTVSSEGRDGTLKYDGRSFSMGECGAIVKNANSTDNGDWICHLGIDNEALELEATVAVKVTDTYLIATEDTVYAGGNPTLSCQTFLGEEGTLQYCRWVRPDGHGINKADASRYDLQKGTSDCSLTILTLEPEDIGQWQCVASLSRAANTEEWAAIELKVVNEDTKIASILSIVFGSGLLVIALIGAFFAAMHIYKRRNARIIKSPPPYYPEDYGIPHGVKTDSDPTIKNGDYVY